MVDFEGIRDRVKERGKMEMGERIKERKGGHWI